MDEIVQNLHINTSNCQQQSNKVLCEMQKLLKVLKKYGLEKQINQAMADFLQEAQKELNISFVTINEIYNGLRYKKEIKKASL